MAHVSSGHIEVDGKFYLVGGPNDEIIGGPYASAAEADNQSRLVSQMVGEAPIEDYRAFLSSPRTNTRPVTFEADWSKNPYGDFDYERQKRLRGGPPSWIDNVISNVLSEFRGPVGDKAYRQPPRLDWEETLPSFLPNEVGMDWPWVNPGKKKRPNLPEVEEWNPSNDYKIRVLK